MSYLKINNQEDTNNIIKSITPDLYKRYSQLEYDTKEPPSFYLVTTTFFIPGKNFSADEFSRKSEQALQSAIGSMFVGYDRMYRHLCSMTMGNHWNKGSKRKAQPFAVCFVEIGGKPEKKPISHQHQSTNEIISSIVVLQTDVAAQSEKDLTLGIAVFDAHVRNTTHHSVAHAAPLRSKR